TFGPRSVREANTRVETLRYYQAAFEQASAGAVSSQAALDLHAARLDLNLRLWRRDSPGPLALGIWALLYSPNVADDIRARCLAARLSELPALDGVGAEGAELRAATESARVFFAQLADSDLRQIGQAAVERVEKSLGASVTVQPVAPFGEQRLAELVSILLFGEPSGEAGIASLTVHAGRWMRENRAQLERIAPDPVAFVRSLSLPAERSDVIDAIEEARNAAADFTTIPKANLRVHEAAPGVAARLIGPELFSPDPSTATYLVRRVHASRGYVDALLELYPGRLTQALQSSESPARRLAKNPAIVEGIPLYLLRRMTAGNPRSAAAILWRIEEARALCRLVAALGYHIGRLGFDRVVVLFETEGFMPRDEAELEAMRVAREPEVLGAALGARALHILQGEGSSCRWDGIAAMRGFAIRKLWHILSKKAPPADLFAGTAVHNY
ncbi:MAG TPA: hypothetical protein VI643_07070, partial [Planctomycetota bacterium]|nr:hypothetical protein [Planctomycetota bacterium]